MGNVFRCESVLEEYDVDMNKGGKLVVNNHRIWGDFVVLRIVPHDSGGDGKKITVKGSELIRAIRNAQNAHQ